MDSGQLARAPVRSILVGMQDTTAEEQLVQQAAERFAAERVAPGYQAREREGRIARSLIQEMGGLGLIAPEAPLELGGAGSSCYTTGLVIEAVAQADINVSYVQLLGSLAVAILSANAAPQLAREWVGAICSGERVVGLGLTEPHAGSDAARIKLRAVPCDDGYSLHGEKASISMADQLDAAVVFARTEDQLGARGISAFLVPLTLPGISCSRYRDVGSAAVGRGSLFFDGVKVEESQRIGRSGEGFTQVMRGFDYSRALIGLQCIGAAWASLQETWHYVTERHVFGEPLSRFQAVTFALAEGETMLTAARALCNRALQLRDSGGAHTTEAAMCKWWAPQVAFDVIHRCLLLHGHAGYSCELPHQQRLREVMGLQIGDGTAEIMKLIIARQKLGRTLVYP